MTLSEILALHQRVVVCGRSCVGKSTLVSRVADRPVWNTGTIGLDGDTPADVSFEDNAYYWLGLLGDDPGPWLLEGTGAYRVLRAGFRDLGWEPDAVVHVVGRFAPGDVLPSELPSDPIEAEVRRGRLVARARGHETVWHGYLWLRDEMGGRAPIYEGTEEDFNPGAAAAGAVRVCVAASGRQR